MTHTCTDRDCGSARDYGDFCETHYRCEYGRTIEERLDEDMRKLKRDLEMQNITLEGQRQIILEKDKEIQRLHNRGHSYGNGLPN